jgi:ubiquinone/menaquinone biosynthesis C-methylase UbiE
MARARPTHDAFDAHAAAYQAARYPDRPRTFEEHAHALRRAHALALLDEVAPSPRVALDVGCGPGVLLPDLLARAHEVLAIDASSAMTRHAVATARTLAHGAHAYVLRADAGALPIAPARVDAAVCLGLLSYLDDVDGALRELARVLTPGGYAIVQHLRARTPLSLERSAIAALGRVLDGARPRPTPRLTPRAFDERDVVLRAARAGLSLVRARRYDLRPAFVHRAWPFDAARLSAMVERVGRAPLLDGLAGAAVLVFQRRG